MTGSRSSTVSLAFLVFLSPFFACSAAEAQVSALLDVSPLIDFVHYTDGGEGLAGIAWLDYDADGDLDLFLTNGIGHSPALLSNDGTGAFVDVTVASGLSYFTGGSGVAAGDLDNDGYPELVVVGEGGIMGAGQSPTKVFHNNGDGSFDDVTADSGVVGPESTMSLALGDVDNDGYLDVFITAPGSLASGVQHPNRLYLNNGDLTFIDISALAGIDTDLGACAVSFTDFDEDGHQDILVAVCNDVEFKETPFELFRNNGDLTFTNIATQAGLNKKGFWMSMSLGDIDNDGDLDFFSTNAGGMPDPHGLFVNEGGRYRSIDQNTDVQGLEFGWGSSLADFDNDGDLDLFFAGSLPPAPFGVIGPGLGNPGHLLENDGTGDFDLVPGGMPIDLSSRYTSGVAHADANGDGFPEVVVATDSFNGIADTPALLSSTPNGNHWVTIRPVGTISNRGGVGARLHIITPSFHQVREVCAGSSFASSETPWPTFGLGSETQATLEITWPSGLVETFPDLAIDQTVTLTEGSGQ